MAYATVVTSPFFRRFSTFVKAVESKHGRFNLVMLVPSAAYNNEAWSLLVSATWLDGLGLLEGIRLMSHELRRHLSADTERILRTTIFNTQEDFVRRIAEELELRSGSRAHEVKGLAASGELDGAIAFVADPSRLRATPQISKRVSA